MADYPSVCLSCWDSIPRPYRRAPGRPFAPDRELLEPEPGAWILVPSTAGYAAPLAGNDGYPRCGGRTRLVTTPEIARVPFSGFNLHVPAGIAYLYLYMSCTGPTPDISSRLVVVHLQINPASTLFVALANLLRVSQAAPPSSTSPCRELCLLFFPFHLLLYLFPPSPSWGAEAFYLCLVAHILPRPSKRLFYTAAAATKLHPSLPPALPLVLASPRLTCSHRASPAKLPLLLDKQLGWLATHRARPRLFVCLLFAIHSPAALPSPCVRPPRRSQTIRLLLLTHSQSKNPGSSPVIHSSSYRLLFSSSSPPC